MSSPPMPVKVLEMLARPNVAVMATVGSDGRPVTAATWYLLERDHRVLFSLDAGRARVQHLQRDPRISITVLASDGSNTHISLQGWTNGVFEDTGLRDADRMAVHYTGFPHPDRQSARVSLHLQVELWRLERRSFPSALFRS